MSENVYIYPKQLRRLRACIHCHLLKTEDQFQKEGCENCGTDKRDTNFTTNFKGIIAVTDPIHSWAAKWLNISDRYPGFYCLDIFEENDNVNNEYEEDDDDYYYKNENDDNIKEDDDY